MTNPETKSAILPAFDGATASLVRLSARITAGSEDDVRDGFAECIKRATPPVWIEEVVLQSYLFAGFPRALNAAREWRRALGGSGAERSGEGVAGYENVFSWREQGEETCSIVYGKNYEKLRQNILALHPALDDWMIVEGYGKVLSRPGLDLARRELCIVAACVGAGQDRQLHSHLHGAVNAGVSVGVVTAALACLEGVVLPDNLVRAQMLWARVVGK